MNSMQTCNSVTFYFMKNLFSDVCRKCFLLNIIRAELQVCMEFMLTFFVLIRAIKFPKGASWVFSTFYDKSSLEVLVRKQKEINFSIFFINMGKLCMQCDPVKAQLKT